MLRGAWSLGREACCVLIAGRLVGVHAHAVAGRGSQVLKFLKNTTLKCELQRSVPAVFRITRAKRTLEFTLQRGSQVLKK